MATQRRLTLLTFGFKYGAPPANYYFDVSFLKNPAREQGWSLFDQPDDGMRQFVLGQPLAQGFLDTVIPLIAVLLEADADVRIGIGCSSGRHRSNIVAEEIERHFLDLGVDVRMVRREETYA
ncbi:RNase adapter RapZ [Engelhardtia mirabilis]|uniref:GlmZ(SRNA)-inactivating NTPase n=1 Tax=Engelhardtia mirabilis TaxID=2528011 RepID=A0A518BFR0_9BACT|nr:glmZ(sRNA)-inactivating NTPase [Planctomycetes bacterium Pla133]QDV00122.1 glmZ(sRNA)-inactivating NTPase [Planctomycetes bacterium Pla86]